MKRAGGLFEPICSFDNLLLAGRKASRGKRARPDVARFNLNLEIEIAALREELLAGTYRPGPYGTFHVREPVVRMISAAPFRDRVVHHALMNVVEPVLERGMIADSYACRRGKGTHRAMRRCRDLCRRHPWVLRGDIRKFFPSIDHEILLETLARKVKDRRVLALARTILAASNPQEETYDLFPGDDLLTPLTRRRGIPIGNLTSQILANLFLDPLDHFVKERLRAPGYVRYCDDICVFGDGEARLTAWRGEIEAFLAGFRLRLHPRKTSIRPAARGVDFVGFRIVPGAVRLRRPAVRRFRERLARRVRAYARGEIDLPQVRASLMGWIGHARHAGTWRLRARLLSSFRLARDEREAGERRRPGRVVEQQRDQPPVRQPQQERSDRPEQQHRVPLRPAPSMGG